VNLPSYAAGRWYEAPHDGTVLPSAIDGHPVAQASSAGLNFAELTNYARTIGGRELRKLFSWIKSDDDYTEGSVAR